ncbi:MAG: HlyD family type I secretion periplasmic adaptor subunit [Betaproteobacteria bacterium]|nr:HlyD family type I secretion periplasmic adaptor subunit [Betaproteobacteria bacterium]
MNASTDPRPVTPHALALLAPLERLELEPPPPLAGLVLRLVLALVVAVLAWACLGRLDVVSVAEGRLVPRTRLKVVQPADGGIVRNILVQEGDRVVPGQVLVRMDSRLSDADQRRLVAELKERSLQLRRIDAELAARVPARDAGDPEEPYAQMIARFHARRRAFTDVLAEERAALARTEQELASARATERRLRETLATFRVEERAWRDLQRDGFAGRLQAEDKRRKRAEAEQDLEAQVHVIAGLRASIEQARRLVARTTSEYRQQLLAERVEAAAQERRLREELAKQAVRRDLLELRAPQAAIVKELATHTEGAVLAPGTVLMTLVPSGEALQAEVWIGNEDIGFVREGQPVRVKLAPFPFQKYGMLDGTVTHVSVDATETPGPAVPGDAGPDVPRAARYGYRYRAIVDLPAQSLEADGVRYPLSPGMQVNAEILLGERRVIDYVLSPVRRAFHEAGRER